MATAVLTKKKNVMKCSQNFSVLMLGLLLSPMLPAQPDSETMRPKVEAMAVGFLTEELELDVEKAQVFWPIFNAHKELMEDLRDQKRKAQIELAASENVTMEQFNVLLEALEAVELEEVRLRSTFLKGMAEAFDPDFAVRCIYAQKAFQKEVRERFESRMSPEDRRAFGKMGRGPGRNRR